ncbi:galactosyltransferase-related protein [Rhizobium binxianense]
MPHAQDDSNILTIIITLRVGSHYDMVSRLQNRLLDTRFPPRASFLVVDEGSAESDAERLQQECERLGFKYLRAESGKPVFCAATARNAGVAAAQSKFIMHEDVDLFPYPGFYQSILDEIDIQELALHEHRFITVPTIYLSEDATLDALNGKRSKNAIIHDLLLRQDTVNSYLPASSVIVVSKNHYLSIGGYDDRFLGWGLEDLEYAYRLTRSASLFLSPADHRRLIEYGYGSSTEYRGWRAQFRLHGELLSRKGIYIFHAYHPKNPSWSNREMHARNRKLFDKSIDVNGGVKAGHVAEQKSATMAPA